MHTIERLSPGAFAAGVKELAEVLADAVDDGASLGFVAPFGREPAARWWREQEAAVAGGSLLVWAARDAGGIVATAGLSLPGKANSRHRAEVVKLLVHRDARGRGLARALLATLERAALAAGVTLLVLDTRSGSAAESLYLSEGWTRFGVVPGYAADPDGSLQDCGFFYKLLT
ncbi:GNAT family N-acetyltransferase [Nonomuraea sp. SBT364]|uniref:GNAT family N-acetyltransferase n=1 Tax=Nonomuraea sp. SBT364 TaxID=1580530 RepID=UPI00066DFC07|nr:GNAT family N-acetyltransferase [Nonomuraea sp. SBT364]